MFAVLALESTGNHKLLIREYTYFRVFSLTLKRGLLLSGDRYFREGSYFRVSIRSL